MPVRRGRRPPALPNARRSPGLRSADDDNDVPPVPPEAATPDAHCEAASAYPSAGRGFQIDLGELAEEFADCTEYVDCNTGECRVKVLPTLYRIIRLIADSEDLANALSIILEVMEQRMQHGPRHGQPARPQLRHHLHS